MEVRHKGIMKRSSRIELVWPLRVLLKIHASFLLWVWVVSQERWWPLARLEENWQWFSNWSQSLTSLGSVPLRPAGTWDALLQSLHLDTHFLQQQNTKKLSGTKHNYMHVQLGQILDKIKKNTKKKKKKTHFWRVRSKSWVHAPCTQQHPIAQ